MQKLFLFAATAALLSGTTALAQGDECATALAVVTGANGPFSNVGATTSVPAWPCAAGGNDVWFSWLASCTGQATLSLCGATYDSCIEAFSGACGSLTSLGCNDDSCGLQSTLSFACTSGQTYFIRVGGFGGATGTFPLNITCAATPPGCQVTTYANNNGGAVGGAVYFDLNVTNPAGITLNGLSVNVTGSGSVDLFTVAGTSVGNETNIGAWTLSSSGTITGGVAGAPTSAVGFAPVQLPFGTYGLAIRANGVSHNYTNGTGANQTYTTADWVLQAGEASNTAFTAPLFNPRVVNATLCWTVGATGTIAVRSNYGNSCYACKASIYDNRAAATTALNGVNLMFVASAGGFVVIPGGSYTAPSGAATALALTDDSEVTQVGANGTYQVCSNGFISIGGSNGIGFTPTVTTLLNNAFKGFYTWHDFNPGIVGSGQVKYENVSGVDVFTWDGVWDFGGASVANANTMQWRFDASGSAQLSIVAMSGLGNGFLVGYSPAGASADPGNTDLTTLTSVTLCANDANGLSLDASARPLSGTSINLNTGNVPAATTLSAVVMNFSAVIPGVELSGQGMPNCYQNVALLGMVTLGVNIGNAPWSQAFFIPPSPIYIGMSVFGQSAALVPGANPFGAISSNGLRLTVGNL